MYFISQSTDLNPNPNIFVSLVKIDSWGSGKEDFFKDMSMHSYFLLLGKHYPFKQTWIPSLHSSVFFVPSLLEKKLSKFVWGFSSHSRIFHSYGDVTFTVEGLSWPLSSEGSLACHTYCDSGHWFMMVVSKDPWHSHLLPSI